MVDSSSDSKKNLMLALGAGAVLIGAALVYSMWSGDGKETEGAAADEGSDDDVPDVAIPNVDHDDILKLLQKDGLDPVVKDQNNDIDTNYFLKLLQFVGKQTHDHLKEVKKEMTKRRREYYRKDMEEEYEECVAKVIKLEDRFSQDIVMAVLGVLDLNEQQFTMKHMTLSQNPQYAEFVMAAQQGKLAAPSQDEAPKLTKKDTIKHLEVTARIQVEQIQKMGNKMNTQKQPTTQDEQMKMMTDMMVEQCKSMDKIYFETGAQTEPEEFEAALMHYCARDPQVAQAMQAYMQQMRGAMPQGAGGMGGGMGGF